MKTLKQKLTEEQEKIIALYQHTGEAFFILEDDDEVCIYEGEEERARLDFLADIDGTDDPETESNFRIYCGNNLPQAELNDNYLVYTDDEANEAAKEYITETIWAFNPGFLSCVTGIHEEVFRSIQDNGKCESNNDVILSLVDDIDDLVETAIQWDGRGHFLSSYDGCENEEEVNGTWYYIYKQN